MKNIQYFSEGINFQLSHQTEISSWIVKIIQSHGFKLNELNYIFCSDRYLLEINRKHLNHDYYTDIITFDNSDQETVIESDIFISIDRVNENATKQNTNSQKELSRVIIHGVLHLLGFQDKTDEEKKVMREKEDTCLSLLKI
ncbi:rRNA maturation RNase YbeY [Ekhidna sp.]